MTIKAPIETGPEQAGSCLILAHGAGQGPDSPFMNGIAERLAASGLRVIRFSFPYMARMQREQRRRPPDPEAVLVDTFLAVVDRTRGRAERLLIGGKSMGGRIASLIADQAAVDGLVCLGFPFHPPGRPERWRGGHLARIRTPTLICQGERDPFGRRDEVSDEALAASVTLCWIDDGEHSFKPRARGGRTLDDNLSQAADAVAAFAARLPYGPESGSA
jgi:predicted alpha/beta-hydrolase family hydrolase